MPLSQRELDLLDARGRDLEKRSRLLLGADVSGIRGPAAKAAALSGYLSALDGKVPTSYDDMLKAQKEADARAALDAQAKVKQAERDAEQQRRIQEKADERNWRAWQSDLERKSREQMKRDEIAARPAPRDPLAEKIEYDKYASSMDKVDTQIKAEKAYENTVSTLDEMNDLIDKYGDSLFRSDTWIGGARDTVGKNIGSDEAAAREKFDLLEARLIENAVEARKGTGTISDKDLEVIQRGGVGRKLSSAKSARGAIEALGMFAKTKAGKKRAEGSAPNEQVVEVLGDELPFYLQGAK